MTRIAESYQCEVVPIPGKGKATIIDYRICGRERRPGRRNPINERVREWGMDGCSALHKRLPEWIFQLPQAQLALFLRTFIDCDGWFDIGKNHMPSVNVTLANKVLVQQIGQLALRLGITGTYRYKPNGKAGAWTWFSPQVDVWQQRIGSVVKADTLARAVSAKQVRQTHATTDWDAWRTARPINGQTFADCPPGYEWRKVVALRTSIAPTVAIEVHNDNHAFVGQAVEHNTNCFRLILAQFLACGADLYLANPNFAPIKLNGRAIEDWRPIVQAMRHAVAWQIEDIQRLITNANRRLDQRREQQQVSPLRGRDIYLALGEWPAIQSRWKDAAKPVAQLLREARQYGIHVVSEFQDALVSTLGMSSGVRESFRNAYYFGGDANTARVLLDLQGKGPLDETGLGRLGASLFRANSQPAVRGRVPFLSNQALYMLLGTPNNPLPDRLPEGADPREFFADHGIAVEDIDGELEESQIQAQSRTVYTMPGSARTVDMTRPGSGTGSEPCTGPVPTPRYSARTSTGEAPRTGENPGQHERTTGTLGTGSNALAMTSEQGSSPVPESRSEYRRFTPTQEAEFVRRYRETGSIKESITQMHLSYGRYQRHASEIVQARRLKKEA